jgi:hypothetical protein
MTAEQAAHTVLTVPRQIIVTDLKIAVDGLDISAWVARDRAQIIMEPGKAPVLRVDILADNISATLGV